jgi:hypothetical protein
VKKQKFSSGELTTSTTLVTGDHLLQLASLILLVIPSTKATIRFSAHPLLLFLWLCGDYGLTERGIVIWRWGLCKGVTLWSLGILAKVIVGIGGKRERKVVLKDGEA